MVSLRQSLQKHFHFAQMLAQAKCRGRWSTQGFQRPRKSRPKALVASSPEHRSQNTSGSVQPSNEMDRLEKKKIKLRQQFQRRLGQPGFSALGYFIASSAQMSHRIAVIVALMTVGVAMAAPVKAKQQSLRMASSEARNNFSEYLHVCFIFVAV